MLVCIIRGGEKYLLARVDFCPKCTEDIHYVESFNGRMRDELLDREIFYTVKEAKHLIEMWRWEYNHVRPHSSLGYRPPAPSCSMEKPHPDGLCGKPVVVMDDSS